MKRKKMLLLYLKKYKMKIKEGMQVRNIIPDFTKPEIDFLLENCNFTKDEKALFELRNDEHSLEECAELMNVSVSTIYRINSRMNKKIAKVI